MHCYRHRQADVIAICQFCGKVACPECCHDMRQGVACSNACEHELRQERLLTSRMKQSYGVGFRMPMPASIPTYFFFGLILLLTGFYLFLTEARIDVLILAMSAVFFVMSAGSYKRYRDTCTSC